MTGSRRLSVALALAGLCLVAARPAMAMSGDCLWDHLRPETRTELIRGYMRDGPDVLGRVFISDAEYDAVDTGCDGSRRAEERTKERLLAAVVFEHGSAVFLKQRLGWRDGDIQSAWDRILPADQARLRRSADTILSERDPIEDDLSAPVRAFLGGRRADDDASLADQARGYLTSRSMREAIERRD